MQIALFPFVKWSLLNYVLFVIMDAVWLGFVVNKFFAANLGHIARMKDGGIQVNFISAALVYVLMAAGLELFVMNNRLAQTASSVLILGLIFGFVMFGIFDFTNHAILRDYPLKAIAMDMAWGTVMSGIVAFLSWKVRQ